jgi:two-component system, OmpR family, sensor histidine kinase CreC
VNIAIRFFLGYFLIVGLAAWFVLDFAVREVEPGIRQAAEDSMVDTANLLAEQAITDLRNGELLSGRFASAVQRSLARQPRATIFGVDKAAVDLRVYVTDARGIVIYDSQGVALNADYSQWQDVHRVLHGQYGARSTRVDPADPASSILYVAAPILDHGKLDGVITVAKPVKALIPYAERARHRVRQAGVALLAVSAAIGLLFTLWLTWSLNRLRDYARAVANGERVSAPTVGGHQLSELARSLASMRESLDGKQYVESYMQSLTHEIKSPLTAVRASAELLQEDPGPEDRRRFLRTIEEQTERMRQIVERLLLLARVEQLQVPEDARNLRLGDLLVNTLNSRASMMKARGLKAEIREESPGEVRGDPFLLQQALDNLIDNAIDFSPQGGSIEVVLTQSQTDCELSIRDEGPGAPAYALPQLFERFYSLPRPSTGQKSTGLGLSFVREVAKLHGGSVTFRNLEPCGALVCLTIARNRGG